MLYLRKAKIMRIGRAALLNFSTLIINFNYIDELGSTGLFLHKLSMKGGTLYGLETIQRVQEEVLTCKNLILKN